MASGRHSDVIEHMRKYQGINAPIVSVSAMLWRPVFTVRLLLVVRRQISHRHTGILETPKPSVIRVGLYVILTHPCLAVSSPAASVTNRGSVSRFDR